MITKPWRRTLLPALTVLLVACASQPTHAPRTVAVKKPDIVVHPIAAPAIAAPVRAPAATDFWSQMRSSFAMSDCDADPEILAWARRYTKNTDQFEDQLRQAMPQLIYVHEVAVRYGVPGEFALLPWIESGFQSLPGRRNRPAGMWQIVPATARKMGLRIDHGFDARLDVDASANAVMTLLGRYHDTFGDWRIVDYAYNIGEFHVAKLVNKFGTPPPEPVIPRLPVRSGAKEHLTRLLAMACVVREPQQFGISLPTISDGQRLVQVSISQSMPMAQAADQAGLSIHAMKDLNAAFRSGTMDAGAVSHVLLPANHAQQFRDSLSQTPNPVSSKSTVSRLGTTPAKTDVADGAADAAKPSRPAAAQKTHTVKSGESLWQIARRYSVSVAKLQQWNHLRGQALKPGQILKLSAD